VYPAHALRHRVARQRPQRATDRDRHRYPHAGSVRTPTRVSRTLVRRPHERRSAAPPAQRATTRNDTFEEPRVPPLAPDHLVYVTADLDAATADLEQRLGVRPAGGGSHVGRGTRNTLLSLGPDVYLELLGPDPGQDVQQPASRFPAAPLLRTWAVKAPQIDATVEASRERGYDPGEVQAMSRARPDGVLLEWRLTSGAGGGLGTDGSVGLVPFLIDWGATEHPALSAPQGCRLTSLRAEHPDPAAVTPALEALGVTLEVTHGPTAALIATIDTPNGPVELR
jgi:hypothetical protein